MLSLHTSTAPAQALHRIQITDTDIGIACYISSAMRALHDFTYGTGLNICCYKRTVHVDVFVTLLHFLAGEAVPAVLWTSYGLIGDP